MDIFLERHKLLKMAQEEIENLNKHEIELVIKKLPQKKSPGTSLVAEWLRIRLPMQGTWFRSLVRKDPTCHRAAKPMRQNY